MTAENYVLLAYAIGIVLMWGYAVSLWLQRQKLRRRDAIPTTPGYESEHG